MVDDLFDLPVHPLAALFPLLPDDELADLVASIKLNGQRDPIILGEWQDDDGKTVNGVIDGRNRLRACKIAKVKPKFEELNGADPRALIADKNIIRRDLSKGQKAMATAMLYPEPDVAGRGKKGVVTTGFSRERLQRARIVLHEAPDLAPGVLAGASLDEAYADVLKRRKAAASEDAQIVRLIADAPDLHELFIDGKLPLAEAIAALDQRVKEQAAVESNQREIMFRTSYAVAHGTVSWANDDYVASVRDRLTDKAFRKQLIERLQPFDPSEIPAIVRGARAFAKLLGEITKDVT